MIREYVPSYGLRLKAKNKFLMFDVNVTNQGNDEAKLTNNFFKLKLGEKTYETSEEGGNHCSIRG